MKKNKFVKLIEHILVSLPLFYVGGVALYTMINENSNVNYSGHNSNEFESVSTSIEDFVTGVTYYYNNTEYIPFSNSGGITYIECEGKYASNGSNTPIYEYTQIRMYSNVYNGVESMYFVLYNDTTSVYTIRLNSQLASLEFVYLSTTSSSANFEVFDNYFSYRIYEDNYYLDNALPYAMSEFNKLGFNKIPFTSFFVNIFHNGETNVYIDFVNNYLNYMLFVECSYFVPMILYWFIHFGEEVLDRFTRKGYRL